MMGIEDTSDTMGMEEALDSGGGGSGDCGNDCRYWHSDVRYFIYDQFGNMVAEYDDTASAAAPDKIFFYADRQRLGMLKYEPEQIPDLYYYFDDHLGSTSLLVYGGGGDAGAEGEIRSWYEYLDYGKEDSSQVTQPAEYQFTGHRFVTENNCNLYYCGARFYHPDLMRFLSVDPAGQFASPYIYASGRPTIMVDPNGEWFFAALFIANTVFQIYKGYEAGGLMGAYQAGFIAAATAVTSQIGSEIVFNQVFNASIGYDAAGMADPKSFTPLEDVLASAAGGAAGGVAG